MYVTFKLFADSFVTFQASTLCTCKDHIWPTHETKYKRYFFQYPKNDSFLTIDNELLMRILK